ncbi:MAG: fibronectin type III domain-containing protein [Deltaproteobacteria bacterium]|nr:fibronectin type III domain-containing protein [Deltaproteobacteria bacterium]
MRRTMRLYFNFLVIGSFCLSLWACGGSVARYDPGPSAVSGDVSVIASGDRNVTLAWKEAENAAAYAIYYSTSQGVTTDNGTKFGTTTGTSAIVTGLENDTPYYFVVVSVNSSGESGVSNEVSGTPSALGPFEQNDLKGTWRFNILVTDSNTNTNDGWMRGVITIEDSGAVAKSSFLDNTGGETAPSYLFPSLYISQSGQVRDAENPGDARFLGSLGGFQRKIIVGTLVTENDSHLLVVLLKHDPLVTFSNVGDLAGFGGPAGGARRFSYSQLSSGAVKEWEFAIGQIGQDRGVQYSLFTAPSNPETPGKKATTLSISDDGIISETGSTVTPQPTVRIQSGVMSDDKSLIVATATDSANPSKYVLRIYEIINVVPYNTNTFSLADLAGSYSIDRLILGTSTLTASGVLSENGVSGLVSFISYQDSSGSLPPPAFTLGIADDGILSSPDIPTLHGKMAYYKDIEVFTQTVSSGAYSLSVALKSYLEK